MSTGRPNILPIRTYRLIRFPIRHETLIVRFDDRPTPVRHLDDESAAIMFLEPKFLVVRLHTAWSKPERVNMFGNRYGQNFAYSPTQHSAGISLDSPAWKLSR
jgi:hypothetical protein